MEQDALQNVVFLGVIIIVQTEYLNVVLLLEGRRAVLFIIVLGFINFLEWPVILSRGLNQLLPLTIIIRTLIFILIGFELYQLLIGKKAYD